MTSEQQHRLILQILMGSAWADQTLAPQEISYLKSLLKRYKLSHDAELKGLLETPVSSKQTEKWIITYLRNADEEERMILLAKIGKLLISDDQVSDSEHDLLDQYHDLMARIPNHTDAIPALVKTLGQFVRASIKTLSDLAER